MTQIAPDVMKAWIYPDAYADRRIRLRSTGVEGQFWHVWQDAACRFRATVMLEGSNYPTTVNACDVEFIDGKRVPYPHMEATHDNPTRKGQ